MAGFQHVLTQANHVWVQSFENPENCPWHWASLKRKHSMYRMLDGKWPGNSSNAPKKPAVDRRPAAE